MLVFLRPSQSQKKRKVPSSAEMIKSALCCYVLKGNCAPKSVSEIGSLSRKNEWRILSRENRLKESGKNEYCQSTDPNFLPYRHKFPDKRKKTAEARCVSHSVHGFTSTYDICNKYCPLALLSPVFWGGGGGRHTESTCRHASLHEYCVISQADVNTARCNVH